MKKIMLIFLILSAAAIYGQVFNKVYSAAIDSGYANTDTLDLGENPSKLASVIFSDSLDGTYLGVYTGASKTAAFYPVYQDSTAVKIKFRDNTQVGFEPPQINQLLRYFFFEMQNASGDTVQQVRDRTFKYVLTNF